jgi:hypothetical protein
MTLPNFFICILSVMICGCGPSAKQLADRQAHADFRQAIAAVKVCTRDHPMATYPEFREKRLALETYYTANQTTLADEATAIEQMEKIMDAMDTVWAYVHSTHRALTHVAVGSAEWNAMLVINPSLADKADLNSEQRDQDYSDFDIVTYSRLGLSLISKQCDALLK